MKKAIAILMPLLMLGCGRIERNPDYGSRDKYRQGFDGCLSGVSSHDGSLYLIIVLVAVAFYLLGKSGRK